MPDTTPTLTSFQTPGRVQAAPPGPVEPPTDGHLLSEAAVAARVQPVVQGTPGVATLVPSLATALGRLRLGRDPTIQNPQQGPTRRPPGSNGAPDDRSPDTSEDGVTVVLDGGTVTAVVDITVTTTASVLATAKAVHAAISQVLQVSHPDRHTVTVNVLGLEAEPDTTVDPNP